MSTQLPLDVVSNSSCYGAFAVYRVSSSYTGPTVTIRRTSDNATSDFYADAYGQLGTTVNGTGTTVESWLNGSQAYITKWYDQSGKGNHATQSTNGNQPLYDINTKRVDFTANSATSYFNLPNGTVPQGRTYSILNTYISGNSSSRTTFISDNNSLESIYDTVMSATVTMNGDFIGYNASATFMKGSRSAIVNDEFNVLFSFNDGAYTKAGRVHFRKNGNIIDCYQSARLYWTPTVTSYNLSTVTGNDGYTGASGYGILNLSIPCNAQYTVITKHNNINNTIGCYLGGGDNSAQYHKTNNFRRNTNNYNNYWYGNDFFGKDNVYATGNTVTYAYDGSYSNIYINGTPQGVSQIRSGWNGVAGNEFIGRSSYGTEYMNGEMYFLFIFKSFLSTNDRRTMELGMSVSNKTKGIKFSQLKASMGVNSTGISFSHMNKILGIAGSTLNSVSNYDGVSLKNGLIMRYYANSVYSDNPAFFNNNTPTYTGVTTNLRNTYSSTGGFNDPFDTNFFTNTSFALGNGVPQCNPAENNPTNVIIQFPNPGETIYCLQQYGYYAEYQMDLTTQLVSNTTYIMSGWYSKSTDHNGADTMFHARTFSASGNHIATDYGLYNVLETRVVDGLTWSYCSAPINTPSDYNNAFNWYVGFGTNNTVGCRYYTKMSMKRRVVYSCEVYGLFYAPITGTFTFYMSSDESSYFWLGDNAVSGYTTANSNINNAAAYGNREKTTTISLTAGTYYPIRIQYSGTYFSFSFTPPGGIRTYDATGYFYSQSSSSSTNMISNNNLAFHYAFDNNDASGTTIANWASGKRVFDATAYNGASISTSDYKVNGSSLALSSASSQYVQAGNFKPTSNGLTFSVWYRSNGSGNWSRILDFGNGTANDNIILSPSAYNGSVWTTLGLSVYYGSVGNNFYLSDINYNDNVWRHITWTMTYATPGSSTSTWNIYVNGILKATTTNYYPSPTVTRTMCYIGKSHWSADGYYNGYIDEFRIYNRVLSVNEAAGLYANSSFNYMMKAGSNILYTQVQGLTPANPATSGYAMFCSNPWLSNDYYWIKSSAMPNALLLFVDIKNGGYDFYKITGGTSVNYITQTHSGTALGLELVMPRSQKHWRTIYDFIHKNLGSDYLTWFAAIPIYNTSVGNYGGSAMYDSRYGNNGSSNGVSDWRVKDGGLWYLRDTSVGEPSGDYTANAFLGSYSEITYPQWLTSYGAPFFNDANANYYTGTNYLVSTNMAGSSLNSVYEYYDGSSFDRAAPSAVWIKNLTGTSVSGLYWINLPTVGPTQIYCIMDSNINGGGWMMAMKATRGTTFNYDSTHWTTTTTLNTSSNNRSDADAKFHSMNYFQCKDMIAFWPDIPYNYNGGTGGDIGLSGWNMWCWMKNDYNSGTRQSLISYFSTANNVSFGVAKGVQRGTAFSSQAGNSFYGANFTAFANTKVRWGLAWNNENDWNSNDVMGGIGMYANWGSLQSFSAGDQIGCCQDQTGINRSARVEIFIR